MLKFFTKLVFVLFLVNSCTHKPINNSAIELKNLKTQIDTIFQNYIDNNYINNDFLKYYDKVDVDCRNVNKILYKVLKNDQLARVASEIDMETTDVENQSIVISIFDKCKDSFENLDEDSKEAVFLTIQHSGDVELTAYFYRYKSYFTNGELALYVDRFLMCNNKPQIFGSQFHYVNGEVKLFKVSDKENLNHRRKIMGMTDIETYLESAKTN